MIMEWYRGEGAGMDEVSHSVYVKKPRLMAWFFIPNISVLLNY